MPCVIPVKRWIPRESGRSDLHERVEGLVQLPAAHEHGAHLGHLAEVAAVAVGLGVERHELGGREGLVELGHERADRIARPDADGWGEVVHPRA